MKDIFVIATSVIGTVAVIGFSAIVIVTMLFNDTPKPSGYHGRTKQ